MKASKWIGWGYLAAGVSNVLGILIFSKAFSNTELTALYPEVFSNFGMLLIMVWGLGYISVHRSWAKMRGLAAVFAVEKFVYVVSWFKWLSTHSGDLPGLIQQSPLTGVFYLIYGPNDLIFCLLFLWAFTRADRRT